MRGVTSQNQVPGRGAASIREGPRPTPTPQAARPMMVCTSRATVAEESAGEPSPSRARSPAATAGSSSPEATISGWWSSWVTSTDRRPVYGWPEPTTATRWSWPTGTDTRRSAPTPRGGPRMTGASSSPSARAALLRLDAISCNSSRTKGRLRLNRRSTPGSGSSRAEAMNPRRSQPLSPLTAGAAPPSSPSFPATPSGARYPLGIAGGPAGSSRGRTGPGRMGWQV